MAASPTSKFSLMYDTYGPLLYGIALQISSTEREAEQILISTFTKARRENIEKQEYPSLYISLLKFMVQTAHHRINNNIGRTNFKIKQFEETPMLHKLICEQMSLQDYCIEKKITKEKGMTDFRNELALIIRRAKKTNVSVNKNEVEA